MQEITDLGALDEVVPEPCGEQQDEQFLAKVTGVSVNSAGRLPAPDAEVLQGFLAMCRMPHIPQHLPCLSLPVSARLQSAQGHAVSILDDGVVVVPQSCTGKE